MTGTHLAHYRIDAELGRGGMGIVYRAHDTKLDRIVALKVLPPHALASEDDRARFQREARAAAKLHHAHIASIFEIGEAVPEDAPHGTEPRPYIAMEFVDGESLADRIAKGPLKLQEAIRIATEVAVALGVAHEAGIVHRDVKSGNVMLTAKGDVKVLDFGLAKTASSTQLTRQGSTLGTVAYMSPEQARGDEVDHRTDLWALGVMLYEMVAGRLPFSADYEQAALYGILNEDPEPLTAIRTGVPMPLEWIVTKLLAKSADARYQSARDLVVDLTNIEASSSRLSAASMAVAESLGSPVGQAGSAPPGHDVVVTRGWPILLLVAIASLSAGYFMFSDPDEPAPRPLTRVELPLRALQGFSHPTLSPTGEWLAVFGFDTTAKVGLYLHELATGRGRMVPESGGGGVRESYFSPDGTQLAYTRGYNSGVSILTVPTGRPRSLGDRGRVVGWLDDDALLVVDDSPGGASYRYDLSTGTEERILDASPDLPDGRADVIKTMIPGTDIAFGHRIARGAGATEESDLIRVDLRSAMIRVVETGVINPQYVRGGFLVYQQGWDDGPLVVRRLDESTGEFTSPPVPVFDDGRIVEWSAYAVEPGGGFLYDPSPGAFTFANQLFRVDLKQESIAAVPWRFPGGATPRLSVYSPDGEEALVELDQDGARNLGLLDLDVGSVRQVTFGGNEHTVGWSPDGEAIWFECGPNICRRSLEEGADVDTVLQGRSARPSRSGRYLAYERGSGIYVRDFTTGDDIAIDTSSRWVDAPRLSPDERYVAYVGDSEDSRESLIVRPLRGPGTYSLSESSPWLPVWSPDGRYIYFGSITGIRRVRISTDRGFRFEGSPEAVVDAPFPLFDLHPNETELLVSSRSARWALGSTGRVERPVYGLVWLQNWSDHLDRTLPR